MKQSQHKIAIVGGCLSSYGGGAPRSMAQQAKSLQEMGHAVTFFAGKSRPYPFTPTELDIKNITASISNHWGPSVLGLFPKALFLLWKEAPTFDVIHLNGAWNLTTFIGAQIAQLRNTPYIISCRSHYGDYHFSRMPLLKKLLFNTLERINIKNAYALHVTAHWEEKTSWRAVQLARKIITIPNPVNLDDFKSPPSQIESRRHLGLDPDRFHVIHLGRLSTQKNLPFLLQAFHRADLGPKTRLVFVGPPEPAEKKNLQQLATELGIAEQVVFIDFAKGRERCHWLAAADLFALPSHDENFCIAAIEAVAAGTFCLLSPQVGAVEYFPEGCASVVDVEIKKWADELTRIQRNPSSPNRKAINQLMAFFSPEAVSKQWLQVYQNIKKRGPSR